jgi:hypothetical protein
MAPEASVRHEMNEMISPGPYRRRRSVAAARSHGLWPPTAAAAAACRLDRGRRDWQSTSVYCEQAVLAASVNAVLDVARSTDPVSEDGPLPCSTVRGFVPVSHCLIRSIYGFTRDDWQRFSL